jgi:hypothetical protein
MRIGGQTALRHHGRIHHHSNSRHSMTSTKNSPGAANLTQRNLPWSHTGFLNSSPHAAIAATSASRPLVSMTIGWTALPRDAFGGRLQACTNLRPDGSRTFGSPVALLPQTLVAHKIVRKTSLCWRERPLPGNFRCDNDRQPLAGQRP